MTAGPRARSPSTSLFSTSPPTRWRGSAAPAKPARASRRKNPTVRNPRRLMASSRLRRDRGEQDNIETPRRRDTMPKAIWNGKVIAETDQYEVVEGNVYFPREAVNPEYLK